MDPLNPDMVDAGMQEVGASSGVFVGASACYQCLVEAGLTPEVAGITAVFASVALRVFLEWYREHRRSKAAKTDPKE
jgi:hypothetical protein